MEKKATKREIFNAIKARLNGEETSFTPDEMIAAMDHELELLDKKSANKKMTKTQEENVTLREVVFDTLKASKVPMTVSEVIKANATLNGLSTQRVSPMLKSLEKDGRVAKTADKKRTVYSVKA